MGKTLLTGPVHLYGGYRWLKMIGVLCTHKQDQNQYKRYEFKTDTDCQIVCYS